MKATKFFAMMLAALVSFTFVSCSDDDKEDEEVAIKPVSHDLKGYIYVSTAYFKDQYYGNDARLKVYVESNQYVVEFSDPQWGDAKFVDVKVGETLSGAGQLSMDYRGETKTYRAVLGGPMMLPVITIADLMGGTTIAFHPGDAPEDAGGEK